MRKYFRFQFRYEVLINTLTELGYTILYNSIEKVEAKKDPFYFQFFTPKKGNSFVEYVEDWEITPSKLKKELSLIRRTYTEMREILKRELDL